MPTRQLWIEDAIELARPADEVWAALRDPRAYFAWNPVATLVSPVTDVVDGMRVVCRAPLLGTFTYVHRVDDGAREVTHEVPLRIVVALGDERHRWSVEPRAEGCAVRQVMDVRLTTLAGRALAGPLERQLRSLHAQNFSRLCLGSG